MIEKLWETGTYETWLETRPTKATVGVHRALVRWSDGVVRDSHVKVVFEHPARPCHHLVNEAVSWLAARALKLPVASFAGLTVLSEQQIARAHPSRPVAGETAAWVTSSEPDRPLYLTDRMQSDQHLTLELQRWPNLVATCAFDEWLANVDRFPRNLLRRAQNDFILIDHDFIAGGPHWLADSLSEARFDDFTNVLRDRCSPTGLGDPKAERGFSNEMVAHSERYAGALSSTQVEIDGWLMRLLDSEDDQKALGEFMRSRAESAPNLIRRRYKLLM